MHENCACPHKSTLRVNTTVVDRDEGARFLFHPDMIHNIQCLNGWNIL